MHAHYIFVCLGQYLDSIGFDQGERSIYGILVTPRTYLTTYLHLSTQASMHANYGVLGPISWLSGVWSGG